MAHPDCDLLLQHAMDEAVRLLDKAGGFLPFAVRLTPRGEVQLVTASDGPPDPEAMESFLADRLREAADAGEVTAGALVADVQVSDLEGPDPADAVRVLVGRVGEEATSVFAPYAKPEGSKTHAVGDLTAAPPQRALFA